ncbi:peptide MFS transporter, partial [Gammaproteobacteria bacterium]|nr:peptide MFS transporter [Gammaproteobacteria bacterium]
MFKGQPKGLFALALANTGERFGYYTMLAIFILFLQAKFGYTSGEASEIYGIFLGFVYFMPFIGGILADKFGYGKMVTTGIAVMFAGYVCLAIPTGANTIGEMSMFAALFLISVGTGLFKGNLQVMVGNLYDSPEMSKKRDSAFSLFYMAINIGALFAPTVADKITNFVMTKHGMAYNPDLPALAHKVIEGSQDPVILNRFTELVSGHAASAGMDIAAYAQQFLETLSTSYHYGFAVACISLVISMAIYYGFRYTFKQADYNSKTQPTNGHKPVELTKKQTRQRITALLLVFSVVIFFWMAFHQNGLTLTFFARDYTTQSAEGLTRIGFDVWNLVLIVIGVYSAFAIAQTETAKSKIIASTVFGAAVVGLIIKYTGFTDPTVNFTPQIFQQFNPFFVVALTPVSMAVFAALAKRGKEPSAPRKIGIGMLIAALGFTLMAVGSWFLPMPGTETQVAGEFARQTPNLLISTYLVLTFAELFLSPMGISFVSSVAPPKYKGMMMGGWFA